MASANARSSTLPSVAAPPSTSQQTSETGDVSLTGSPPAAGRRVRALPDLAADRAGQSSSAAVASVHRSSSARSETTLRQTANAPSPRRTTRSSFFTTRNPPPRDRSDPARGSGSADRRCVRQLSKPGPKVWSQPQSAHVWGYVDLNHGPRPYQGRALTD